MTTTALPLAVFSAVGTCDARHEHTHRLIAVGETAYAYSPEGPAEPTVYRDGTMLSFDCTQLDRGEPCMGRLEFLLDEAGAWTADADARLLLARHGKAVQR